MRYPALMNMRSFSKITRAFLLLLLLTAVAAASAQDIDPRARQLLEGLSSEVQPVRNMDLTILTTITVEGQAFTTRSRNVVDYENQRMASITEMQGMETRMVMVDGVVKMKMMGMDLPVPAGMADELADSLKQQPGDSLWDNVVSATFDGPVNYGDLLVGDQVTYVGDAAIYGAPSDMEVQYVFAADGALLGMHAPTGEEETLMVFKQPMQGTMDLASMNLITYILQNGAWEQMADMVVESVAYDVELDESLFQ
jgi:hypothetical protein